MTPTKKAKQICKCSRSSGLIAPFLRKNQQRCKCRRPRVHQTADTSFGEFLGSAYSVLKCILENLDWVDLMHAAQVCKSWAGVVKIIEQSRNRPVCFFIAESKKKSETKLCFSSIKLHSKPALCLAFLNERACGSYCCCHMPRDACISPCGNHHRLMQYVEDKLQPTNCNVMGVVCHAVKACFYPRLSLINVAHTNTAEATVMGFIFPNMRNLKISKFILEETSCDEDIIKTHIGENYHVKCLLIFYTSKGCRYTENQCDVIRDLMYEIWKHQPDEPFALGGALVKGVKQCSFNQSFPKNKNVVSCIAFSAPANYDIGFEAYSIILWDNCLEVTDIDATILKLSKSTVRRRYMVALRFACVSRYFESRTEVITFKKYFPEVPLIGLEGMGEIGLVHLPTDSNGPPKKKRKPGRPEIIHQNTTIIVLFSWGQKL